MTKIITPQKSRISVSVPKEYIGLPVAITMVLVGNRKEDKPIYAERLSDRLCGSFTKEDAEDFIQHTKQMREEWDTI